MMEVVIVDDGNRLTVYELVERVIPCIIELEQKFPLLTCPQLQIHSVFGAGFPQLEQNFP